ncbi:MAG TPA: ATP-binding protein [Burkholderiaceae bacterium]|nr:ATP-binding protein [Burkholderiaceae bacterium]
MQATDTPVPFSPRVPTLVERRVFIALAVVSFAFVLAIVPWAREPGIDDPRVTLIVGIAVLLANVGTAVLLGAWYRSTGRVPLLVLTGTYLFSGIMAVLHMLAFPGALLPQPLFGDEHTVGWIYSGWRGGVALGYLAAVALETRDALSERARWRALHLLIATLAAIGLAAAVVVFAVDPIGPSMAGSEWTTLNHDLVWVWIGLYTVALAVVSLRRAFNDTFYLWLSLVLVAAIVDLVLSNLAGGRYTLGWHASRASFVVSAYLLLVYVTRETAQYRPLALLPLIVGYAAAVSAACAAVFLRWLLHPWLGLSVSYITLYGAVAISVWLGGFGPAIVCAAVGYTLVTLLFVGFGTDLPITDIAAAIQLALFALSCALIIGLGEGMRRANVRHRASETQLRENQRLLAAELAAMERLHSLSSRLLTASDLTSALDDVLANAVASCNADFGNIQLHSPRAGGLEIVAQRGFTSRFLAHFSVVPVDDTSTCGRALRLGERVAVSDVTLDEAYAEHRAIAAEAGYRAVQSTPLKAHNGAVIGVLSTHFEKPRELSEREQQLLDLYARHATDLVERMRYEQALKTADRRKDEFLATLAHELRNPLAPIRNALAIMGAGGPLPDRLEKARQVMGRQVHHLVRLVDDLLDASRITLGKVQLRKEPVSLLAVLKEAVETATPAIREAGHELHVSWPSDPLPAEADPTRIAQVVVNLLNNAIKFTARGGQIWLTAERQGDMAAISVGDTGSGIDPEHLETVFEMFSQPAPALYRTESGLGIGLAIVRGLVELHGGSVHARSAGLDKGSEFVVQLPLQPAPAAAAASAPAAAPAEEQPGARKRVLVVDDNRDVATTLREYLELHGHDVREAHDGVEGVHVASEFKPDLVLLDIGMPRMNGYEAAVQIRRRLGAHPVRIVAVTGWGHADDKLRARDAGFDLHLTKPVDPRAVAGLL